MAEFSPTQLDALEDALEDLELAGLPAELESDVGVAGRLGDYRDLLLLSREALPLEEVPAGVLASVLAEAAGSPAAVPAPRAEEEAAPPWWQRLSTWIPVLAVGASAALVLVMVRGVSQPQEEAAVVASAEPRQDDEAAKDASKNRGSLLESRDALQAAAEGAPSGAEANDSELARRGRLRGAGAMGEVADGAAAPDPAAAIDGAFAEADLVEEDAFDADEEAAELSKKDAKPSADAPKVTEKLPYEPGAADDAAPPPGGAPPSQSQSKSKSKSKGKKKPASRPGNTGGKGNGVVPPKTEPKPKPAKPSPAPSTPPVGEPRLSAADAKRREGRCSEAKATYQTLVTDGERSTRARALAGLGLCALQAGDESAASNYFAKAKKLDSSVAAFIERERGAPANAQQQSL